MLALPSLDGVAVDGAEEEDVSVGAVVLPSRVGAESYQRFLQILFSGQIKKVTHQAKELMEQLLAEGLSTDGFLFDTALGAYLLSPTDGSYALEKLAVSWLSFQLPTRVCTLARTPLRPWEIPLRRRRPCCVIPPQWGRCTRLWPLSWRNWG